MQIRVFSRWLIPLLLTLIACGFQTTFWPELFGQLTAPPVWLVMVIWLSLYRTERPTILLLYAMGFCAALFSAMPLKMMLFSLLFLHFLLRFAKERFFWSGAGYFTLASALGVLGFHLIYLSLSNMMEPVPTPLLPFERLTQSLWASVMALPLYNFMQTLESWTQPRLSESGGAT